MRKTMMYDGVFVLTAKGKSEVLVVEELKRGEFVSNVEEYSMKRYYETTKDKVIERYKKNDPEDIAKYLELNGLSKNNLTV
jgi:precorrin-6B methylase 1